FPRAAPAVAGRPVAMDAGPSGPGSAAVSPPASLLGVKCARVRARRFVRIAHGLAERFVAGRHGEHEGAAPPPAELAHAVRLAALRADALGIGAAQVVAAVDADGAIAGAHQALEAALGPP